MYHSSGFKRILRGLIFVIIINNTLSSSRESSLTIAQIHLSHPERLLFKITIEDRLVFSNGYY